MLNISIFNQMMIKYAKPVNSPNYQINLDNLKKAIENGITYNDILYFSDSILPAPRKNYTPTNSRNYNPIAKTTKINPSYKEELNTWKTKHVFPYFLAFGFSQVEINKAWQEFKTICKK